MKLPLRRLYLLLATKQVGVYLILSSFPSFFNLFRLRASSPTFRKVCRAVICFIRGHAPTSVEESSCLRGLGRLELHVITVGFHWKEDYNPVVFCLWGNVFILSIYSQAICEGVHESPIVAMVMIRQFKKCHKN